MDAKLTLESAKKTTRQRDAVYEQQRALNSTASDSNLDVVHTRRFSSDRGRQRSRTNAGERRDHTRDSRSSSRPNLRHIQQGGKCNRCGRERHAREKCPAQDAECHNCQRRGHYNAQCHQKAVLTILEGDILDTAFLDSMMKEQENAWFTNISVSDREMPFNLDTGAEVTAISKEAWEVLRKPRLQTPDKQLFGPAHQPLKVLGYFTGHLSYKGRETNQYAFVVTHLKNNLLGLTAISALHLATRIESCEMATTEEVKKRFPKIFPGLGNLGK